MGSRRDAGVVTWPILAPPIQAEKWYDGTPPFGLAATSTGTFSLTADRIYAIPFWTPWLTTWGQIGLKVLGADAGKKIKLGIYERAPDGEPGSRLFASGEFALDASGDKTEGGIAQALSLGWSFLAIRSDSGAATLQRQNRVTPLGRITGASGLAANGGVLFYSDSGSYAVDGLPASFPGSPTIDSTPVFCRPMLKTSASP